MRLLCPLVVLQLVSSWPSRLRLQLPRRLPSALQRRQPRITARPPTNTEAASAVISSLLPFEPQPLPSSNRSQWFEGWFVRLVDHDAKASVALILGSLRRRQEALGHNDSHTLGARTSRTEHCSELLHRREHGRTCALPVGTDDFDEHILVLAYRNRRGRHHTYTAHLHGPGVTLSGPSREAGAGWSSDGGGPQMVWWSRRHGGMAVHGNTASIDVTLPGGLTLVANISGPRVAWSDVSPDREGPEGWLARTGLLPCHYFVHTFGSRTTYRLRHGTRRAFAGIARSHMERNYGDTFPAGYTWAQASAQGGAAYLVLTGGLFVVGPLTTRSYIVGLRAPPGGVTDDGLSWDFRSTDLDRIRALRRPCAGKLELNATARNGRRRLLLRLSAPPDSFGAPMPIPTEDGFSNQPGCRESYAAIAHVVALVRRSVTSMWEEQLRLSVPLATLEFGGTWQC